MKKGIAILLTVLCIIFCIEKLDVKILSDKELSKSSSVVSLVTDMTKDPDKLDVKIVVYNIQIILRINLKSLIAFVIRIVVNAFREASKSLLTSG